MTLLRPLNLLDRIPVITVTRLPSEHRSLHMDNVVPALVTLWTRIIFGTVIITYDPQRVKLWPRVPNL